MASESNPFPAVVAAPRADSEKNHVEQMRLHSSWPIGDVEDTDLERRVLAHERILQALIAHMAEGNPLFFARLSEVFSDTAFVGRREHDYTDTHNYAHQFIQEVARIIARRSESGTTPDAAGHETVARDAAKDAVVSRDGAPITLLEVSKRSGVWAVTKDGKFYGHYIGDQSAFDAAEAEAMAIVAGGGTADLSWDTTNGLHDTAGAATKSINPAPATPRKLEFRATSVRVVR